MEQTHKINKIEIRNLRMEDYDQLAQSFTRVYADKDVFWTRAQIKKLITIFPEGQIVTVADRIYHTFHHHFFFLKVCRFSLGARILCFIL